MNGVIVYETIMMKLLLKLSWLSNLMYNILSEFFFLGGMRLILCYLNVDIVGVFFSPDIPSNGYLVMNSQ